MYIESQVILISAGPRRKDVIVRVRDLLKVSLQGARELVDKGNLLLAEGGHFSRALEDLRDEFRALGAEVSHH